MPKNVMKKTIMIAAGFLCWSLCALGQDTLEVTPVAPGPSENRIMDSDQKEERVAVELDKLPPRMQKTLADDAKFANWKEGGDLYYDKGSEQYIVHVVSDNKTITYRFDKKGNPLATDEMPVKEGTNH